MKFKALTSFILVFLAAGMLLLAGCAGGQQTIDDSGKDQAQQTKQKTGKTTGRAKVVTEKNIESSAVEPPVTEADKGGNGAGSGIESALEMVFFEFDKSRITPEAASTLKKNRDILLDNNNIRVRIEGYCDERGTQEYNLALGERRANAVKRFLSDLRIDPNRMETISYGEERPLDPASNEAAWAKNRRAEFRVID